MSRRSKNPPTRKAIDNAVRRLVVAERDLELARCHGAHDAPVLAELNVARAALTERLDALFKRQEELLEVIAEAYVAVGSLLIDLDAVDSGHGTKLLDNLAAAKLKHKGVIPFPSYKTDMAQQKPLTERDFKLLYAEAYRAEESNRANSVRPNKRITFAETVVYLFARAVEAKHGIGGES